MIPSCNIFQEDNKGKPRVRLLHRNYKKIHQTFILIPIFGKLLHPSLLAEMKKQNSVCGLSCCLQEITSSEAFKVMSRYQASTVSVFTLWLVLNTCLKSFAKKAGHSISQKNGTAALKSNRTIGKWSEKNVLSKRQP